MKIVGLMERKFRVYFTTGYNDKSKHELDFTDKQLICMQKAINLIMNEHGPKATSVRVGEVEILATSVILAESGSGNENV